MKKSVIAISTICVLGVGYLGATWYTGKILEDNIDSQLKSITQQINHFRTNVNSDLTNKVEISAVEYQRGFFSSQFKLLVSVNGTQYFYDMIQLQHGPFAWEQLSHGQFSPKLATLSYRETPTNSTNKQEGDTQVLQINQNLSWGEGFGTLGYDSSLTVNNLDLKYDGKLLPASINANRGRYVITIHNGQFSPVANSGLTLKWDNLEFNDGEQGLLSTQGYFSFANQATDPLSTNNNQLAFKSEKLDIVESGDKITVEHIDLLLNRTNQNNHIDYNGKLELSKFKGSSDASALTSSQQITLDNIKLVGKFNSDNIFMADLNMAKEKFNQLFNYPYSDQNSLYDIYTDLMGHYLHNDNAQFEFTSSLGKLAYQSGEEQNYFTLQDFSITTEPKASHKQMWKIDLGKIDAKIDDAVLKLDGYHQTMSHAINDEDRYHEIFTANLNQYSLVDENEQETLIEKLAFYNQQTLIDNKYLSGNASFSVQKSLISDIDWGNGEFALTFKNLPAGNMAANLFLGYGNSQQETNKASSTQYPFAITLNKFDWNTPKGRLTADADLALTQSLTSALKERKQLAEKDADKDKMVASLVQSFRYNADISLDGLTYLVLIINDADDQDLADEALFTETKEGLRQSIEAFSQETLPMELSQTALTGNVQYDANQSTGTINGTTVESANLQNLLNQLFDSL